MAASQLVPRVHGHAMHAMLVLVVTAALARSTAVCDDASMMDIDTELFLAPAPGNESAWRRALIDWRSACRATLNDSAPIYAEPSLRWTQTSYIQPQMHPYDRFFYDPSLNNGTGSYTTERWLADVDARYGGVDSLLFWPTYTNIGVDDRNQYDLVRALPGGTAAIKAEVAKFHARGIRVLLPYNPWDNFTRPVDPAHPGPAGDPAQMAALLAETGADGFNGDTMRSISIDFLEAARTARNGSYIALQPESGGTPQSAYYDTMSWGYWSKRAAPGVDKLKWLDSAHMTNVCSRWVVNKTDDLQGAFFNGVGYESWENVWGIWNGISQQDGEAVRRVATLLRFSGTFAPPTAAAAAAASPLLHSPAWEPHTALMPGATGHGLFASKWTSADSTLWHVVNRAVANFSGALVPVPAASNASRCLRFFDLYHGVELAGGASGALALDVEALGFGALLALPTAACNSPLPAALQEMLGTMRTMTARALASYDKAWRPLAQRAVAPPHAPLGGAGQPPPPGMSAIPATPRFRFQVKSVAVEPIGPYPREIDSAIDVQYHWEATAGRYHDQLLNVSAFYIDTRPVTVEQFRAFVNGGWEPRDRTNFLKGWSRSGVGAGATWSFPANWSALRPVTHVSLNDARAFCAAAGKRLPREWEWQLAAQGTDGRLYPWGDDDGACHDDGAGNGTAPACCYTMDHSRVYAGPQPVDAQPSRCASPYGVEAMSGTIWQWTDEFQDEHTRAAILRGSANYRPASSMWFFPSALELNKHGKYFVMSDSYERAGTVGFRCAADVASAADGAARLAAAAGGHAEALGAPYCPSAMTTDIAWPAPGSPSCVRGFVDTPPQTNPTALKPQFVNFSAAAGDPQAFYSNVDDWIFFGSPPPRSRMAAGAHAISDFSVIDGGASGSPPAAAQLYSDNPTEYSWKGGAPVTAAARLNTSVQVLGVGNGFSLSVPASDAHVSVLRLFLGVYNARAHISAAVVGTDGAAPTLDSTFFDDFVDAYWLRNEQYVLQFRAAAPGAVLHVNFTMAAQSNGDNAAQSQPGKVLLSAASLVIDNKA